MSHHQFNPSNKPNTCLWCGVKLRMVYNTTIERVLDKTKPPKRCNQCVLHEGGPPHEFEPNLRSRDGRIAAEGEEGRVSEDLPWRHVTCGESYSGRSTKRVVSRTPRYKKSGPYGDGCFCGTICSGHFAVAAANNGYRFKPRTESTPGEG